MVGHGGSSAGSYLTDPTSPIPYHCASIITTSTVRVSSVPRVKNSERSSMVRCTTGTATDIQPLQGCDRSPIQHLPAATSRPLNLLGYQCTCEKYFTVLMCVSIPRSTTRAHQQVDDINENWIDRSMPFHPIWHCCSMCESMSNRTRAMKNSQH